MFRSVINLTIWVLISAAASPVAAELNGWHDATNFANSPSEAFGWACDTTNYSKALQIEIYDGTQKVGTTLADIQRESAVADLCGGVAKHGFVWSYPETLRDGKTHEIKAYAILASGARVLLPGSPVTTLIPSSSKPEGWFDFITPEYAWGWACDPSHIDEGAPSIEIELYDEAGDFLGSVTPNIYAEQPVADRCGGAHNRSFQFKLPASLQDSNRHTIYAFTENADGSGRSLIGGGPRSGVFYQQSTAAYGSQPYIYASDVETVIQSTIEQETGNGHFKSSTFCYGTQADDVAATWQPSNLTGLSVGKDSLTRAVWQRGAVDSFAEIVVQAKGSTVGVFTKPFGSGWDTGCGKIAGNTTGFLWNPGVSSYPPVPWPDGTQNSLAKELVIKFTGKFYSATGVGYVHPALFFRDKGTNLRMWVTLQAFDTRSNTAEEFIGNDCPADVDCDHKIAPIVATAFGRSGSYGRSLSGDFIHYLSSSYHKHEFRINGFQLQNALEAVGCSNSDPDRLSCNAEDFQLTIASVLAETYGSSSSMGTSLRNIYLGRTTIGTL